MRRITEIGRNFALHSTGCRAGHARGARLGAHSLGLTERLGEWRPELPHSTEDEPFFARALLIDLAYPLLDPRMKAR
jgi:hypothetical protein